MRQAGRVEVPMKWSRLVLAAVVLGGFASVASAGSTWILWSEYMKFDITPAGEVGELTAHLWEIENAFETRAQCLGETEKYIAEMESLHKGRKGVDFARDEIAGRKRVHVQSGTQKEIYSAVCLPETVDPREKK